MAYETTPIPLPSEVRVNTLRAPCWKVLLARWFGRHAWWISYDCEVRVSVFRGAWYVTKEIHHGD